MKIVLYIYLYFATKRKRDAVISWDMFLNSYQREPIKWKIGTDNIAPIVEYHRYGNNIKFGFSLIDSLKYCRFVEKLYKDREKEIISKRKREIDKAIEEIKGNHS